MNTEKTFGEIPDKFLADFYASFGAVTTEQKMNLLDLKLGGQRSYHAMGGEVTNEMMLGCLEYEILEQEGLITIQYA